MSDLECAAMPIITPIVEGAKNSLSGLDERQRLILARWIAKTGYVLAHYMDFHRLVPRKHCRHLFENPLELPNGVVAVTNFPPVPHPYFLWFGSSWPILRSTKAAADDEIRRALASSYKIVVQLEHFCFMVAYWSLPGFSIGAFPDLHHVVWPETSVFRQMPGGHFPPTKIDSLTYVKEMIESTCVVEDSMSLDEPVEGPIRWIRVNPESASANND